MNELKPELHIRMSLSPNYTLEIRISERFCLKGDEKLFEYRKFRITEVRIVESVLLEFIKEN